MKIRTAKSIVWVSLMVAGLQVSMLAIALPGMAQLSERERQTLQAQPLLDQAVAAAQACITIIDASNNASTSPTRIWSAPQPQSATVVGELQNFTIIEVIQHQRGWLQIKEPNGWVPLQETAMSCGSKEEDTHNYREQLKQKAGQGQQESVETLIRLLYRSGGPFPIEQIFEAVGDLALIQPQVLLSTLEAQTEEVRSRTLFILKAFGFTPEAQTSFEKQIAKQPNSLTAKTWHSLD